LTLEDGTDRLSRRIGNYQRSAISQNTEDLIYAKDEACNHVSRDLLAQTVENYEKHMTGGVRGAFTF
jgi:hypothetical protein